MTDEELDALQARIAELEAALATARADAIKEAANVARSRHKAWADGDGFHDADGLPAVECDVTACENVSLAIFALLDTPAPDPVAQAARDSFDALVSDGVAEAGKAMRKFPQPNYVISKVAEEAGEVVKAAIHCAEGRETPENLRGEMKQLIAMLYRLWVEGDQVHGLRALAGEGKA
jgi:hypothetical protein